jgi:hypothetical protein
MNSSLYATLPTEHLANWFQDLLSNLKYANLCAGHLEDCTQDLLSNLKYANLCAGHLEDCTQDLSGDLLYANPNYLYARIVFTVRQGFHRRFI